MSEPSRASIRYLSCGRIIEATNFEPTATLLDHLRLTRGLTGTKEGCGEGDCGACTVALGRLVDGRIVYRPVNACILLLGQVDGADVVTVEDLSEGGQLHPVQAAMVAHHGSQCGFCTPGIVMSLFTLYQAGEEVGRDDVLSQLSGNLCRCTGYRPIVEAGLEACGSRPDHKPADAFAARAAETAAKLAALDDGTDVFIGSRDRFFAAPASVDALASLYAAHADATIVAGATDVGLWVTKQLRDLPKIIHVGRVAGFNAVAIDDTGVTLGAGATFADSRAAVAAIDPDLDEVWRRIGSEQVRASGTVGGNIANGSPIGDSPPALIALGATVTLRQGSATRSIPLEDYFLAYGKQDRRPGEFVAAVRVPKLHSDQLFRAYKIAKRYDQDISAVMAAFRFTVDTGFIREARIAFGGMAATPKRAAGAEKALVGASLADPGSWGMALDALAKDYQPIDDMRASAAYRRDTGRALLEKALIELAGETTTATRVAGFREASDERVA
ncbi:MAG: xanthine dehydrogenase small subunit [Ancalomicrobiaceae bacterium]|nr:xanthine dehydrogenase small subunit [Ancalomicrobiaceae bacterium]